MNRINNYSLIEINLNSYQALKHRYNNSYTEYGSFGMSDCGSCSEVFL